MLSVITSTHAAGLIKLFDSFGFFQSVRVPTQRRVQTIKSNMHRAANQSLNLRSLTGVFHQIISVFLLVSIFLALSSKGLCSG